MAEKRVEQDMTPVVPGQIAFHGFDAASRSDQHRHQINFPVDLSGSTQVDTVADFG